MNVTDANGCTGVLQADNSDTVKVVLVVPASDLIPNLVVSTPVFNPANNSRAYTLDVYNIGTVPTSGAITLYIVKPTAAFSVSVDQTSTWVSRTSALTTSFPAALRSVLTVIRP